MVDTATDTGDFHDLSSFVQASTFLSFLPTHSDPLSSKQETKSHDGTTHGGYSYVDAHGHVQSVKYVADPHHGFQIVHATNLPKGPAPVHAVAPYHHAAPVIAYHAAPAVSHWGVPAYAHAHGAPVPVSKTPEVIAAEHAHFAAVAEAKARLHHHHKRSAHYGYAPAPVNGVPVDTPEVQHEKALHFAAVAAAKSQSYHAPSHYAPSHYAPAPQYHHAPAYNHYAHQPAPAPVNGVPVDTAEVQHEKAKHFALVAEAKSKIGYGGHHGHYEPAPAYHHGPVHYPVIHNGVPEDTYEVKAAKAKHFAAVHEAQAKAGHHGHYEPAHYGHEDDGSYDAQRYEKEQYYH